VALQHWFVMDELHDLVAHRLAAFAGTQAAVVTHCAAAGITLSVAAAMAGSDPALVRQLPDTRGMKRTVVLPVGHAVDYGHPITQDVRLAGGEVVLAGTEEGCTLDALAAALSADGIAALLLVSSRLTGGSPMDFPGAVALAHERGIPVIIDGAAQDWRIEELVATGCDALVVSGHKYMASPTAGMVLGTDEFMQAVRAQERGIGRAMKVTKEALLGLLAAVEERQRQDKDAWQNREIQRAHRVADAIRAMPGLTAAVVPDPVGMPFARVRVDVDASITGLDATTLAARLASGDPSVRVMEHELRQGRIVLEMVGFGPGDEQAMLDALVSALAGA
jgi:uncharacterized pyridoxal phosphate-dependent enzyme